MNEYIIQDDYLCCPICLERYNNEKHKYPLCLKCGHTLCRSCAQLNTTTNKIKCPICAKVTSLIQKGETMENKIVIGVIELLNSLNIEFMPLFKFTFSYCRSCNLFLSNFTSLSHLIIRHNVTKLSSTISEMYKLYLSAKCTSKETYKKISMELVLNLFQNKDALKIKSYQVKEYIGANENLFSFYGEELNKVDRRNKTYDLMKYVLSENGKIEKKTMIKKGFLRGKNSLIFQGYILCYENNNSITITKGLGIVKINGNIFYGIVSFIPKPNSTGFSFDYGIYIEEDNNIFFGWFVKNTGEYPIYVFGEGEVINLTKNKVTRRIYDRTNEYYKEISESFTDNKFYNFHKVDDKDIITFNKDINETPSNNNKSICLVFNKSKLKVIKLKSEYLITIRINNFSYSSTSYSKIKIEMNEIYLQKYNINLIITNENSINPVIYLYSLDKGQTIKSDNVYGYIMTPNEGSEAYEKAKYLGGILIMDIYNSFEEIYRICERLINIRIEDFSIHYQKISYKFASTPGQSDFAFTPNPNENESILDFISFQANKKNKIECQLNHNKKKVKKATIDPKNQIEIKDLSRLFTDSDIGDETIRLRRIHSDLINPERAVCYCRQKSNCLIF